MLEKPDASAEVLRVELSQIDLVFIVRPPELPAPSADEDKEDEVYTAEEVILSPAGALIWGFQPLELRGINFCSL